MGTPSIYVYDCSNAGIVVKCEPFADIGLPQDEDKVSKYSCILFLLYFIIYLGITTS